MNSLLASEDGIAQAKSSFLASLRSLLAFAGLMLAANGGLQWAGRNAPYPVDPDLRNACLRTRKVSMRVYWLSVGVYLVGGFFAFMLPALSS